MSDVKHTIEELQRDAVVNGQPQPPAHMSETIEGLARQLAEERAQHALVMDRWQDKNRNYNTLLLKHDNLLRVAHAARHAVQVLGVASDVWRRLKREVERAEEAGVL